MNDEIIATTLILLGVGVLLWIPISRIGNRPSTTPSPHDGLSEDAIDGAVLRDLQQKFGHIYSSIGNDPATLERAERELASIRAYADALADRRWRKAYYRWLDYFERNVARSRKQWAHFRAVDDAHRNMPRPNGRG